MKKVAWPGKWTVPGGGMMVGDYFDTPKNPDGVWYMSLRNTLRREVKEEVNVEIGFIQFLTDMTFIRPDGMPVLALSFYAPYKSGEIKLDDDSIAYAWVTYKEALQYDLIGGIKGEIEMADRILKGEPIDQIEYRAH